MTEQSAKHLPTGWTTTTLGECFQWRAGGTPSRSRSDYFGGDVPWLLIGNLDDAPVSSYTETITDLALTNSSAKWVPAGSLLVAMYGSIGKLGITHYPVTTNQAIAFTTPPEVPVKYLFYYLLSQRSALLTLGKGGTQSNINLGVLKSFPLPLAPLPEQTRIADRIDELFSDLDSGVEALRRVRRKLGRYRAAVLHAAVTGRLSARWREEHAGEVEPAADLLARILKARREHWEAETLRKYEAKGKTPPKGWRGRYKEPEFATSCEFSLPTGWAWATVAQCSSLIQYGTSAKCGPDSEGVPVLRMGNITNRGTLDTSRLVYLPHEHPAFPSLLLEPGDVLFNRTNSAELVGKSALFADSDRPASFASYLIRVQCLQGFASQWAVHCLVSPIGRRWARRVLHHTAGQANINGTKLGAFEVPLPPEAEQSVILEEVDRQLSLIDTLEAEVDRALLRSGRLRQSILKAAFEGKLVPQDPADEPASALLARLRAQADSDKAAGKGQRKKAASKKGSSKKGSSKKAASKKPPRKKSGPRRKAADPESLFRSSD